MPAIAEVVKDTLKQQNQKSLQPIQAVTKDLGNGEIEVIISTNSLDRHGEILDINTLDTARYNGVVLVNHDYDGYPIAKNISLVKDGNKLIGVARFAIEEYEEAATIYKLVKGGYWTDVSIGFIPGEFDFEKNTWYNCEMIEYSFVTVGSNRDAKVTAKALKEIGVTPKQYKKVVKLVLGDADASDSPAEIEADEAIKGEDPTATTQPQEVTPSEPPTDPTDEASQPPSNENGVEAIENDAQITEDEAVQKDDEPQTDISTLKSLVKGLEETLPEAKELIARLENQDGSSLSRKKHKIVLVQAKQSVRKLDRLAEMVLHELKQSK